ncbi:unnamed protein product, partial [Rotaria socialis]
PEFHCDQLVPRQKNTPFFLNIVKVIVEEHDDDDERGLRQKEIINSFVVFEYYENNYT